MQHDTLTEEVCAAILAEMDGELGKRPEGAATAPTIPPPPRHFGADELGTILSHMVFATTAKCPQDDSWLEASVAPALIALRCPQCGRSAEWRSEPPPPTSD